MKQLAKAQFRIWKLIALFFVLFVGQITIAQKRLPMIYANSLKVDVRDIFQKGVWNLSPDIRPDIYFSSGSERKKKVTFFTDIDSISFDVEHSSSYDFLIVLNRTDTCYTRIVSGKPQPKITRSIIATELLQQDFIKLVEDLQREHGNALRYKSKRQLKELCDSLYHEISHPMDQFEFGTIVRYLISAVQDGHTGSSLPHELMSDYEEQVKMFPLQLWFINDKAFVACDKYKELPIETEILSLNGVPINDIKKKLFRYMSSDGKINSKKYLTLNYEGFPYLYSWVYGEAQTYRVGYKTRNGTMKYETLKADFIKNFQCLGYAQRVDTNLQLKYGANDIAILTIRSFDSKELMRTGENFQNFLASSFKEIATKKAKKLIIDLRNNAGGDNAYGALLYSYLTNQPFRFFPSNEMQTPSEWDFSGKVIFVTNGFSFSTASDFAAIARSNDRGVFVGEETGGAYYGGSSGEIYKTVLPNSNIRINIPKDEYSNPVKSIEDKDRGVVPDYVIIPSIGDKIQNRDVQLTFAIKLIR